MDITQSLKSLEYSQILLAEGFSLYEAMSATELFDKKIDAKLGLDEADTPQKLLEAGKIVSASKLSAEQQIGLFDLVINKVCCWINGNALAQTIYTLVYQYDDSLWDSPFINALFQTINTVGSHMFKIIKEAPFLREEDYNPSVFSFRTQRIATIPELLNKILNPLDTELSAKVKKSKLPTIADALSSRIKLLKGITNLIQILKQPYNAEQHKQLVEAIDFIKRRFEQVIQTQKFCENMNNYESTNIYKHIRSMITLRKIPKMEDPYEYLQIMLTQLEAVLDLSSERNLFLIQEKICNIVHNYPKNILIRAYLEQSVFKYDQFLFFGSVPWLTIIINTLKQMFPQNFDQLTQNVYKEYQECVVPVTYEFTVKQLRQKFRKSRDFHKNYQYLSILIHQSNQLDQDIYKTKNPLMIFSYEMALKIMISQLQYGFELELYTDVDYSSIFFYLEYFTTILDRNKTNYLNQLSNSQRDALQKKKQKANSIMDQLYNEISYWKGLNCLFRALSRFCYTLMENGQILKVQNLENRYSNRLKIFEQCYYVKPIKYDEYIQKMTSYGSFQDTLKFVSSSLSEAQQQFNLVKENKYLPQYMQDQARDLIKICVITSVNSMRLISNPQLKIKFVKTTIPFVPQIELVQ